MIDYVSQKLILFISKLKKGRKEKYKGAITHIDIYFDCLSSKLNVILFTMLINIHTDINS